MVLQTGEVVSTTATRLDVSANPLSTSEFSASIERASDEGLHYRINKTLAGIPLHWKDGKSIYHIAQSMVDNGYDTPVQAGFNTWSTLSQLNYTRGTAINSEHWGGNADGINNIVRIPNETEWTDSIGAPYNALNGEITDADIAFNGTPESITNPGTYYYWGTNGDTDKVDIQNTATHEIGHYFGLRHIWGDVIGCDGTDYCNDTPQAYDSHSSCTNIDPFSCGSEDMYQNYLDYTYDRCMNLFTNDQTLRMRTVIENSPRRKSLLTSPGLF